VCVFGGTATLTNCTITSNSASYGGGLYTGFGGTATLTNCTVSGNTASAGGGGVFDCASATTTLTNCTISGNSALGGGANGFNGGGEKVLPLSGKAE
jgi:parallel beta-helix repeat protein